MLPFPERESENLGGSSRVTMGPLEVSWLSNRSHQRGYADMLIIMLLRGKKTNNLESRDLLCDRPPDLPRDLLVTSLVLTRISPAQLLLDYGPDFSFGKYDEGYANPRS